MKPFDDQHLKRLSPTEMLDQQLDCYYERPQDGAGNRVGPLVGYAGTYELLPGGEEQYVGEVYANFAGAEEYPELLEEWSRRLFNNVADLSSLAVIDRCLGMPMGGITFAFACAQKMNRRFGYLEKKTLEPAKEGRREESKLIFGRHKLRAGEKVALVEDVCNNFSTTKEAAELVESVGAIPVAILCIFNRSKLTEYKVRDGLVLPVISVEHKALPEYRQDDPYVVADIAAGNVRFKPKDKEVWAELQRIMRS